MIISAIVAKANNNVIGKDNDIPWYLPADLKYFKKTTLNHHIAMGRKCFQSIGKPLPKRTNVVLTRDPFFIASNCLICSSIENAIAIAEDNGEEEFFIIGGGEIYKMALPLCNRLYVTEVDLDVQGDVFFPDIDLNSWTEVFSEAHLPDEKNTHAYTFKKYERR